MTILNLVLSFLWSSVNRARRRLYLRKRQKWSGSLPVKPRILSVGNLQIGGAGKTPLVAWLAQKAIQRGLCVVISTRGYRSEWEPIGGVILPQDFRGMKVTRAEQVGDEALLLSKLVPRAWICVGKNRKQVLQGLMDEKGIKPDVVILDDGFQNFQFQKHIDLLAVTSSRRAERIFRDFYSEAKWADFVFWMKGDVTPEWITSQIRKDRFFRVQMTLDQASDESGVWLITGVAEPDRVYERAQSFGYQIKKHSRFSDHAFYERQQIEAWLESAKAEGLKILLTGKDAVKWESLGVSLSQVTVIEPKLKFESEQEEERIWQLLF